MINRLQVTFFFIIFFLVIGESHSFVVGSWNIHNGKKLEKIVDEITTSALREADIFALQEVVDKGENSQSERLAQVTGFYRHAPGRDVILSRYPFVKTGDLLVNDQGRRVSWAVIRLPEGQDLLFYSIHLSYKYKFSPFIAKGRGKEMQVILDHARNFDGPVLIAGDYNTVGKLICGHKKEAAIKKVEAEGYKDAHAGISKRTHKLVGLIDYQYAKGLEVIERQVGRYGGSDHRWLLASYELAE